MKKKIFFLSSLLLILAALLVFSLAAGGGADDPLISLNFLKGLFTRQTDSAVEDTLDQADKKVYEQALADWQVVVDDTAAAAVTEYAPAFNEIRLKEGDAVSGPTGLQVIPLAGSTAVTFPEGSVVDVTNGAEVPSGTLLEARHRYLVAENTTASFTVLSKTAVLDYCGSYRMTYSEKPDYNAMAQSLKFLSLFRGTDNAFGEGFDLENEPTRIEALIMLIRLLGEEKEALACTGTHPFTDVPEWCNSYVAYAYEKGYSNGVGGDQFGTYIKASAVMYMEFVLRALGYSSTATTDISDSLGRAQRAGVIRTREQDMLGETQFLRADVVYLSYYALDVPVNNSYRALYQRLIAAGLFNMAQYRTACSLVKTERIGG